MERYDFLIVGAGFTGCVMAERLNSAGEKVLVIEKKGHIGGLCHDFHDNSKVLVHKYGPHYFRTNSDRVISYLSKFTEWHFHDYIAKTFVNGKILPFPINRTTINRFFNINLKTDEEVLKFLESKREKIPNPRNAEEQIIAAAGKEIYEAFFKNYTIKKWDVDPKKLDPNVTGRIPIRANDDDRFFTEKFQAMPQEGYSKMFENMLKGVEIKLSTDFKDIKDKIQYDNIIYTGPIDEFFDLKFGKLPCRSLRFEFETHNREFYQECEQINYPNDFDFTRIVEIKHATGQKIPVTTIVKEYSCSQGERIYPIFTKENHELYMKYRQESEKLKNVFFIGRLAQYVYLNMSEVVEEALSLFEKIKNSPTAS